MKVDESEIAGEIIKHFSRDLLENLEVDVAIVGGGPAGLTAARYVGRLGLKTCVFERNLHIGGGIWGGGILFPRIVVQEHAKRLLEEINVKFEKGERGYYVADSVETACKCAIGAIEAGAKIFVGLSVEDLLIREKRVGGVVINWKAVEAAKMHVDPIGIESKVVIDATGHEASLVRTLVEKTKVKLPTRSGGVEGEGPMWAEKGESEILKSTREVYPGLIVAGMAACTVFGSPRMGPIFGGMLLSGEKAARIAAKSSKRFKRH